MGSSVSSISFKEGGRSGSIPKQPSIKNIMHSGNINTVTFNVQGSGSSHGHSQGPQEHSNQGRGARMNIHTPTTPHQYQHQQQEQQAPSVTFVEAPFRRTLEKKVSPPVFKRIISVREVPLKKTGMHLQKTLSNTDSQTPATTRNGISLKLI